MHKRILNHGLSLMLFVLTIAAVCLLSTSRVIAGTTGSIGGIVLSEQGQKPLAGADVSIQGSGMPGIRRVKTDERGFYHFQLVPPGTYCINVNRQDYNRWMFEHLIVRVNERTRLDITLDEKGFYDQMWIDPSLPLRDPTSSWIGSNLSREFTERLPGSDRAEDIFTMTSLAISPDTSHPAVEGDPSLPVSGLHLAGGTAYDNQYFYDGVNVTNPLFQTLATRLNADAIQEVQVITGGLPAEYGGAMGGIVNVITRTGGEKFSGIIRSAWDSDELTAPTKDSTQRSDYRVDKLWEPTVSLGGPILAESLWFFVSARWSESEESKQIAQFHDPTGEYGPDFVTSHRYDQYWLGNLTWAATPDHRLQVSWSSDPQVITNASPFEYSADAQAKLTLAGQRIGLTWDYLVTPTIALETRLSYCSASQWRHPQHDSELYPLYDRRAQLWYHIYPYDDKSTQSRTSYATTATVVRDTGFGSHEIKSGIEYQQLIRDHDFSYTNGRIYWTDWYGTSHETPVYRYNFLRSRDDRDSGDLWSGFIQDAWEINPGLTLSPGLRFDHATWRDNAGRIAHVFSGMVAPRLGLSWDIFGHNSYSGYESSRSRLTAGYGRYYNPHDLSLAASVAYPTWLSEWYQYDPSNPDADEEGYAYREVFGGAIFGPEIDSHLRPEYTDEGFVSFDRRFNHTVAGVTAIYRRSDDLIEDVGYWQGSDGTNHLATEVDLNDSAAVIQWYDHWNGETFIITNPSGAFREYYALDLHASAEFEKLQYLASVTWSKTRGTLENTQPGETGYNRGSVYSDTPALSDDLDGRLHWDSPLVAKLFARYTFPFGIVLGLNARYHLGFAFNRTIDEPYFNYTYYDAVLPEGRGSYRLPDVFLVDVSIQKDFSLGSVGTLTGIVEVNNLFDNQVNLMRQEHDGPEFGQETSWAPPRTIRFQLCYRF